MEQEQVVKNKNGKHSPVKSIGNFLAVLGILAIGVLIGLALDAGLSPGALLTANKAPSNAARETQSCGAYSTPLNKCRYQDGLTVSAKKQTYNTSRLKVTITCGNEPCRFSRNDFELFSGATGEYPDRDGTTIPDLIAPNRTSTFILEFGEWITEADVLRFHAWGYADAWLSVKYSSAGA